MITVGAFEAKTHLSRLIDQVASGEQVTITRHGVPVACLVPVDSNADDRVRAVDDLRAFSKTISFGGDSIAEMIAEGRKY